MKKYLSAFVCGFGAGVLQIVPVAKSFSCCLIIPAAAFLAILLERKSKNETGTIELKNGILIGTITGLYAALFGSFFDLLVTFITKSNDLVAALPEFQKLITNFPVSDFIKEEVSNMLYKVYDQIRETGFSWLYTFSVVINNFFINTIFGLLGGLFGSQFINSRIKRSGI